jgi:hypothetical protein
MGSVDGSTGDGPGKKNGERNSSKKWQWIYTQRSTGVMQRQWGGMQDVLSVDKLQIEKELML